MRSRASRFLQTSGERFLSYKRGTLHSHVKPLSVYGKVLLKSLREIEFMKDAVDMGLMAARRKHSLSSAAVNRYFSRSRNKEWLRDEIEKAASAASVNFGYVMRKFRRIVEGKDKGDKVIVECLKNMGKMIGAFQDSRIKTNFNIKLEFDGDDDVRNDKVQDFIETTSAPEGDTRQQG